MQNITKLTYWRIISKRP